jgi:hypothetical protein
MHLVVMAWLFVIGTMALTFAHALAGVAFFLAAGVAPVALYAWVRVRAARSMREHRVRRRDDADARRDQQ